MTPEQQRVAIAEACGWYVNTRGMWFRPPVSNIKEEPLPDYINDLNAMHEAEIACIYSKGKGMVYGKYLRQVCDKMPKVEYRGVVYQQWDFSATAAQRAESLLRTIGKWVEK